MAKRPASRPRQPVDNSLEFYRVEQLYRTIRTGLRVAGAVAAVYVAGQALAPLAGVNTALQLGLSIIGDLKLSIAIALTGSAAVWAIVERNLRHRKTEYLQNRIKQLEAQLDPNRSSTGLTPKGQTNPKDRSS